MEGTPEIQSTNTARVSSGCICGLTVVGRECLRPASFRDGGFAPGGVADGHGAKPPSPNGR
jgi:hypothetical protein